MVMMAARMGTSSAPECARLSMAGDEAELTWPTVDSSFGDCSIEERSFTFPARVLAMAVDEFEAWVASENAKHNARTAADAAMAEAAKQRAELATLAALKAKYEPKA